MDSPIFVIGELAGFQVQRNGNRRAEIDNGLLGSRFVHVHTICSHFLKSK